MLILQFSYLFCFVDLLRLWRWRELSSFLIYLCFDFDSFFFIDQLDMNSAVFLPMIWILYWSARIVSVDVVKKYLEEKIFPKLEKRPFSVLYVHTDVQRSENFPGITALRSVYDAIPVNVKENLEAVYFVHPGLQSRLFLATFGRFMFSGG